MSEFEWQTDDDFRVDAMDLEHELLICAMNRLYEQNRAGAPRSELINVVRDLEKKTAEHFRNEEDYLSSIGYSALSAHKRVHQHLLAEFALHRQALVEGAGDVPPKFFAFLKDRLSSHIGDDQKYVSFAAMSRHPGEME